MLTSCVVVTYLLQLLLGTSDAAGVLSNQNQLYSDVLGSFRLPSQSASAEANPVRSVVRYFSFNLYTTVQLLALTVSAINRYGRI